MRKLQRNVLVATGITAIVTIAVVSQRVNDHADLCTPGETRSTLPCEPGPNGATLTQVCNDQRQWEDQSCDVPLDDGDLCYPTIPPVDLADSMIVSTGTYISWSQVLTAFASNGKHQILLQPGDYRSWGNWNLGAGQRSGTTSQPIIVRYYGTNDTLPPWQRDSASTRANIQGILIGGDGGSPKLRDWIFTGLTVDAPNVLLPGSIQILSGNYITIDQWLIENDPHPTGMKIRDSDGVCVQRNVIRNATTLSADPPGIQVKPNLRNITDLRIVQNEIYDWTDSIQVTNEPTCLSSGHECTADVTIEGNDLYITSARYVTNPSTGAIYACAENSLDFKCPTSKPNLIRGNRMWGMRETPPTELASLCGTGFASGSAGDAIVVHIDAYGFTFEENIIGDSISALRPSRLTPGGRKLFVRHNTIHTIPPVGNVSTRFYGGAAFVTEEDTTVVNNVFAGVSRLCPLDGDTTRSSSPGPWPPLPGWEPKAPQILENKVIGDMVLGGCPAPKLITARHPLPLRYQRKRFTGPEWVTITEGYE